MTKIRRSLFAALGFLLVASLVVVGLLHPPHARADGPNVRVWLTDGGSNKLTQQPSIAFAARGDLTADAGVTVDESQTLQPILGFGGSMTDASAWLTWNNSQKDTIMSWLFDQNNGIGVSFLRQPIGAPDFIHEQQFYTLDDTPNDTDLSQFSVAHDQDAIIPLLQQALRLNGNARVMANTWSPPAWMKTNNALTHGGELNDGSNGTRNDYPTFANYLVKFIQAYQRDNGIPIYAITPQNEPLASQIWPSLSLNSAQERNLINNYLAPALQNAGLSTKIIGYDHNWDDAGYVYAQDLLSDSTTYNAIAGVGFHTYSGDPSKASKIHYQFPAKEIWETEASPVCDGGGRAIDNLEHSVQNWAEVVLLWNLVLKNGGPALRPPTNCDGLVDLDANDAPYKTNSYYEMGHFTKFVQPGAYHIGAQTHAGPVDAVSFRNPDGSKVEVAHNTDASNSHTFGIMWGTQSLTYTLPAAGIATFTWTWTQAGYAALDRTGWQASASASSANDAPANALDGNSGTRWSTGHGMANGDAFTVNFGAPQTFDQLALDAGPSTGDYPRNLAVYVSTDGQNWGNPIAATAGTQQQTWVSFPTQTAQYVKVQQLGTAGNWWSIAEFNAYDTIGAAALSHAALSVQA